MLPILRIIPVGGVLLAIAITVLALSAPDGGRSHLARVEAPARGPLVDRESHPEWRQFLIQAALRRAGELERLRELPDTPARSEPEPDEQPQPATEADLPLIVEPAAVEEHTDAGVTQSGAPVAPLPAAPVLPVEGSEVAALQESAAPDERRSAHPAVPAEPTRVATLLDDVVAPIKGSDAMALQAPAVADNASAASASQLNLEQVAPSRDDGNLLIKSTDAADGQGSADADEAVPPTESNDPATTQQSVIAGNTPADSTSQPKPTEVTLLLDGAGPPIEGSNTVATPRPDTSRNASVDPATQPKSTEVAPTPDKADLPIEGTDSAEPQEAHATIVDTASVAAGSEPNSTEIASTLGKVDWPIESSDSAEPQEARATVVDDASVAPGSEPKPTEIAPSHDDASSPVDRSDTVVPQAVAAAATEPEAEAAGPDEPPANVASLALDGDTGTAEGETGAVGGPEDGSPDAVDSDEATLSKMPVALPRERPPGIAEPRQKRRAVRRHVRRTRQARPVRTAARDPATYNFFESLLRMLGANAPPPNSAISRRMTRPLY